MTPPSVRVLILCTALFLAPLPLLAQGGTGDASTATNPAGWYLEGGGARSMERSPFGTRWGDASRSLGLRLDLPQVRAVRPTFEWTRTSLRDRDCFNEPVCERVDGWTLRGGVALGDVLPRDPFLIAPVLRADLGAFVGPDETSFSPSFRLGILVRATPWLVPRLEAGQAYYAEVGSVWELGVGARVTLR